MERTLVSSANKSVSGNDRTLTAKMILNWHRTMLRIRQFEEKVADLVANRFIKTPCHLYTGQEAVATGACSALRTADTIWGTHRSHGHYLAKGGDMKSAMAEIFCRETGCSLGRGGSMHLCAPTVGLLGTSAIVAGSVPLGVGAALSSFLKGEDTVSLIFHGDGAPEEGCYHEAVNFASLHRLPVIFLCEHNEYCTHLHINCRRAKDNLPELFAAYDIPVATIDGNDVVEVYFRISQAVDEARRGNGPSFVECRTYRWRGHVGPNWDVDLGLRSWEEIERWMARCPIKLIERKILDLAILSEDEIGAVHQQVVDEVEEAVAFARESRYPDPAEIEQFVYRI